MGLLQSEILWLNIIMTVRIASRLICCVKKALMNPSGVLSRNSSLKQVLTPVWLLIVQFVATCILGGWGGLQIKKRHCLYARMDMIEMFIWIWSLMCLYCNILNTMMNQFGDLEIFVLERNVLLLFSTLLFHRLWAAFLHTTLSPIVM